MENDSDIFEYGELCRLYKYYSEQYEKIGEYLQLLQLQMDEYRYTI